MPLMVHGKKRDDNPDLDNSRGERKRTTGICVVCDEECASAAEFERRLVMFSAMHATLTVDDDDDCADEDNMRRGCNVEISVRSCDYLNDENEDSHENEDSCEEAIVDEDGANDAPDLWNLETDGDDNNSPMMEEYDVLPYQGEDTSMDIEVAFRRRCKFCAMDIDESKRCEYCYVAPKLDSVDEIGSPSVSDSSMLGSSLKEENADLFNIGSTLERSEQEKQLHMTDKNNKGMRSGRRGRCRGKQKRTPITRQ